jgi:serine protease AprX
MNKFIKLLKGLFIILMLFGMVGPVSPPAQAAQARVHPQILQIAEENPDQWVSIIIQKVDLSDRAERLVEQLGGLVTKDLHIINAFAAELPAAKVTKLTQLASVSWVSLDGPIKRAGKPPKDPDPVETEPQNTYLDTLGVPQVWGLGYTGAGIGVAIIDSGISPDKDFTRIQLSRSFNPNATSVVDGNGHGTHVAGIVAGNGYDSAGVYKGIAPGVSLFSLKISDDNGMAYESDVVAAMQWALDNKDTSNIRVVNLSIQSTTMASYHESPIDAAAEILWFNGVVVVAAAGNWDSTGFNPIHAAPANDPFIITVGATTEKGTPDRKDDAIASFSAHDETQEYILKPEIYAPGTDIISVLSGNSDWGITYPERVVMGGQYFRISGTSMSAPMVTGAVALLLQAEPDLTPDQVKYRLMNTAGKVSKSPGYLDIYAALTTPTTASANTGLQASQLLWTGSEPVTWDSVSWNSVSWNSVSWNSVSWNSVSWNSVSWNATYWGEE